VAFVCWMTRCDRRTQRATSIVARCAFNSVTVSTASPRNSTEFGRTSASCRIVETTYLVAAFMCGERIAVGRASHAVMKSCQVRRRTTMSPRHPLPISRPITSSRYRCT
jgi:hypothetical protein